MPTVRSLPGMAAKTVAYFSSTLRPRREPLAYVGGWLGRANLGDEALFDATRALFPEFSLWHYDGSRTVATLLRAFPRTASGVFAGGTLINRTPEYLALARKFLRAGRKLHFFGTGVADPAFWNGRGDFKDLLAAWRPLLDACGPIGVRGPRSAELLIDAGVANVHVVGDPVLTFARKQPAKPAGEPRLGFNFGFDHGHQWGKPADVKRQMLALARLAIAAGWRVTWFVVFPQDLHLTRELVRACDADVEIVCAYRDARVFLRAVEKMSLFVGMKLHATMLALCAYVPSLMLEYDPKCSDFMQSLGQQAAMIRTDRFDAEAAWAMLQQWSQERNQRAEAIFRAVQAARTRQLEHARQLAAAMTARN